ncbi:MAG: hypothetical protein WC700_14205, partial [Gemmatimonadaceae bacterium]
MSERIADAALAAFQAGSGPCHGCGATNYPLSFGGPNICPACDSGTTDGPEYTREDFVRDWEASHPIRWPKTPMEATQSHIRLRAAYDRLL